MGGVIVFVIKNNIFLLQKRKRYLHLLLSENKKSCMIILRETEQRDGEKYLK